LAIDLEVRSELFGEALLGGLEDVSGSRGGVNLDDLALLLKLIDDGHARLDKGLEALADAVGVIVSAAAGLSALKETALHDVLRAVIEEDELGGTDGLLELVGLIKLAGEAVNEEAALVRAALLEGLSHGVLEELDGDLHGDDETVLDVVTDQIAELRAGALLLGAQQVTSGQVHEAVLGDEVGALGSLAGARAAEDEDDSDVVGGEGGDGLGGSGELTGRLIGRRHFDATLHKLHITKTTQTSNDEEGPELDLVGLAGRLRRDEAVLADRPVDEWRGGCSSRRTSKAGCKATP
jgi:hypothetical protein